MNQYTELLNYIKLLAEQDEFVNTITQGEIDEIDLNKGNIFPLLHIFIGTANMTNGQTISFDVEIMCGALRDENKEQYEDKFWQQDNEVDNLNECLATLNKMYVKMLKDFEDNNIRVDQGASFDSLREWNKNLIDGWLMTFTIEVPNNTLNICQ